ncbi:hypothetical protein OSB04_007173 [Centaurea solstitialis]|uniref:Uncharacterized protein n=1 Tax=Centaurea solstitialis TaxID=347529 RepID=A0AA38U3Y0_9ASTR|nr:hypothetical protein OSB04_007173 [Centaurea solstitialis]
MGDQHETSLQQQLAAAQEQIRQLNQQTVQANEELARLRASNATTTSIATTITSLPLSAPVPRPSFDLPPPPPPGVNMPPPLINFPPPPPPRINFQSNFVRSSIPQSSPFVTFRPFVSSSQSMPEHIPTMAHSTIHTTIQPDVGTSNGFFPFNLIPTSDPMDARLKMLEEQNQKMLALLAKLPGDAVPVDVEPKTGFQASPYVDEIALVDIPKNYNIPAFTPKYSGITDPANTSHNTSNLYGQSRFQHNSKKSACARVLDLH